MFKSLFQDKNTSPSKTRSWPGATPAAGCVPELSAEQWTLSIYGLVETPQTLPLKELRDMPGETRSRRIVSADGWSFRGEWTGLPLAQLVGLVKPQPEALWLKQTAADGTTEYLPLAEVLKAEALLCYAVNGSPLDLLHGGPLRLMVFDRYLYKSLGQLAALEFTADRAPSVPEDQESTAQKHLATQKHANDGRIEAGKKSYAFDLGKFRTIETAGEIAW